MLEHLNHPFLCNLRYSFQDIEYLCVPRPGVLPAPTDSRPCSYIVVDLMNGGDLRFHISRKTFTEDAVRFWIAELGCALRYIHRQGVVHRDVKPDNVLLDSEGHVHLADFVRHFPAVAAFPATLTNSERCFRFHSRETVDEQVGHSGLSSPRSLRGQRLLMRS